MKYCQNCGRPLADNEICNCTAQNVPQQGNPAVYSYTQEQVQNPPKKNNTLVIVIIVIAVLVLFVLPVLGVLAAILVPSMIGYTAKSNQSKVNATAKALRDAVWVAVTEIEEKGTDIGEATCIISSDPSMSVNVTLDDSTLYSQIRNYYPDSVEYDYFVVIEDGEVTYAACSEKKGRYIGTCPYATRVNEAPVTYSGTIGDDDWDLEDLYYDTCIYLFD